MDALQEPCVLVLESVLEPALVLPVLLALEDSAAERTKRTT